MLPARYRNLFQTRPDGSPVGTVSTAGTTVTLPPQGVAVLVPEEQP
jgi:hypothetical protein